MRKDLTVAAAIFAASLVATPLVMSGTKALATSQEAPVALPVATMPVEVAPVAPAAEACTRKVRVVYSGYGTPSAACATR